MNAIKLITLGAAMLVSASTGLPAGNDNSKPGLTFTDFTVPEVYYPNPFGINNQGTMVGTYNPTEDPQIFLGLVAENGVFTQVELPGADVVASELTGVNEAGTAVGHYLDSNWIWHSFVRTSDGTIVYLPDGTTSGPAPYTFLDKINNRGDIVGWTGSEFGWDDNACLLRDGTYTKVGPAGSWSRAVGINDKGDIVGYYWTESGGYSGFLRQEGKGFVDINFPGAQLTILSGINNRGQIVGGYYDADWVSHGFVWIDGVFTTVDYPGHENSGNIVWDINDRGEAVGTYDSFGAGFSVSIKPPGKR